MRAKCLNCEGEGWIVDHSPAHYANQQDPDCYPYGCPVQVQCEECQGTGYTIVEFNESENDNS